MSQSDDHTNKSLAPLHDTTSPQYMTLSSKCRMQSSSQPCLIPPPSYYLLPLGLGRR